MSHESRERCRAGLGFLYLSKGCLVVWCVTAFFLTILVANAENNRTGELVIDFKQGTANQERFELTVPPDNSLDKLESTDGGLRIRQIETGGVNAKTSGFTIDATAASAFAFILDFEIKQLDIPKSSRMQGMWIRFVFEHEEIPALGITTSSKLKRGLVSTTKHSDLPNMEIQIEPSAFSKGTWIVERQQNELKLSISESANSFRVAKRILCPEAPLKEIQVWCTRQSSGNAPAEYIFERARFVDFSLVETKAISRPLISWQTLNRVAYYGYFLAAIGFVGWYLYRRASRE